jgi:hypothetical protein
VDHRKSYVPPRSRLLSRASRRGMSLAGVGVGCRSLPVASDEGWLEVVDTYAQHRLEDSDGQVMGCIPGDYWCLCEAGGWSLSHCACTLHRTAPR